MYAHTGVQAVVLLMLSFLLHCVDAEGWAPSFRCGRENTYPVYLKVKKGEKTAEFTINDIAFVHRMKIWGGDSYHCQVGETYGFTKNNEDSTTVWVESPCKGGNFDLDYLTAHCEVHDMHHKGHGNGTSERIRSPCIKGAIFNMIPTEVHSGTCIMGSTYWFTGNMMWVDGDCDATFKVCETGPDEHHDEIDHQEHGDDHGDHHDDHEGDGGHDDDHAEPEVVEHDDDDHDHH